MRRPGAAAAVGQLVVAIVALAALTLGPEVGLSLVYADSVMHRAKLGKRRIEVERDRSERRGRVSPGLRRPSLR